MRRHRPDLPSGGRARSAGVAACALALPLLFATAAPAQTRSLEVQRLEAELLVRRDGTLLVTERLSAVFQGAWNGLVRSLPVQYPGPGQFNYSLQVRVLGAEDEQGHPMRTELNRRGGMLEVRIHVPGAVDTARTVTLRYRVTNALRFFDGYDELYWNVTPNEGELAVPNGGARVYLPPAVRGLRVNAWEGPFGARERADFDTVGANYVTVRNARPLGLHEGLTVDVAWDPGVVARPGPLTLAIRFLRANGGFGFPLLALAILYPLWYRRGRDPRPRPIAPRYEPPDGLGAAEAGTLLDNSPDVRDITAALVDLAVRGYIAIEEKEASHAFGLFKSHDYVFHRRREQAEWAALREHERVLLQALFADGTRDTVQTSELVNHFYEKLPEIRNAIFNELVLRGCYVHRPDRVKQTTMVAGTVGVVGLTYGGIWLGERALGQGPLSFIVGGILAWLVVLLFARIMPARTVRGARTREEVLGFQEFLRRVESDRLERVVRTPELFEKCLPYAMAFGVAESWARAFDGIYQQPPTWYTGHAGGPFRASMLAMDLGHMGDRTGSAMASSPRGSSSGSGFGGGGGSGGGFGGGGVGGF